MGKNEIRRYSPEGRLISKIRKKRARTRRYNEAWFVGNKSKRWEFYGTEYYGNKRISIFLLERKYIGELRIDLSQKEWNALYTIKFDKDGNVYFLLNTLFEITRKRTFDFAFLYEEGPEPVVTTLNLRD